MARQLRKTTTSKALYLFINNSNENFIPAHQIRGHITDQAAYIDTLKCTEPTRLYPRNLPEVKCFQESALM